MGAFWRSVIFLKSRKESDRRILRQANRRQISESLRENAADLRQNAVCRSVLRATLSRRATARRSLYDKVARNTLSDKTRSKTVENNGKIQYSNEKDGNEMKRKGTKDLTWTQRLQLEGFLRAKLHKREIARLLGVCLATVYNEIKRGMCTQRQKVYDRYYGGVIGYKTVTAYSPNIAHERYKLNQSAHGAPLKLGNDWDFVHYVEKRVIYDRLSPAAVCGEIRRKQMFRTTVSKTTMYRYVRDGIFMNILQRHLPMGQRKRQYDKVVAKQPPKGTSIEKRPIEIHRRNTFGHWEMDCVCGKQETTSTLLVLTERLTRYEIVMRMPNRQAATVVRCVNKLERRHGKQFRELFKSITVDNGVEFSDFAGLEKSIYGGKRTSVYYCHPYTSCERGSNERINRDIRRQFPKGTDFTHISDKRVQEVATWVNDYPREIFGFATSAERFAEYYVK